MVKWQLKMEICMKMRTKAHRFRIRSLGMVLFYFPIHSFTSAFMLLH